MKGFLQDSEGNFSSKRLQSFVSFGAAVGLAIYGAIVKDNAVNAYVISMLSYAAALQGITAFQGR
jgi:hypothetical protein